MASRDPALWTAWAAIGTALGTWALVAGTLVAIYWQTSQQHQIDSAKMVLSLRDRFDSPAMKTHRKRLSLILSERRELKPRDEEVLGFLDTLGLLTHRGILEKDIVWNEFSAEVEFYYIAVSKRSERFPPYEELRWLNDEMLRIESERERVRIDEARPNEAEVIEFLKDESKLN